MPPLTLDIPPEDHDRLLDDRARSSDADANKRRLLSRKLHLSIKKFETDDGKPDSDALMKALSEVMAGDLGGSDLPDLSCGDQNCLKTTHEQERKLAHDRILEMNSQQMESLLKELEALLKKEQKEFQNFSFSTMLTSPFTYSDLNSASHLASLTGFIADTVLRAQEVYKNDEDKEDRLKSLQRLDLNLGRVIANCESIQDYLSVNNLLFWSTREVLDLTYQPGSEPALGSGLLMSLILIVFKNYVVAVLLIEAKAKTLSPPPPGLEQGIPPEGFDKLLKDRLGIVDTTVFSNQKTQKTLVFQKRPSYLTPEGQVDLERFAMEIAKGMVTDKRISPPTFPQVPDTEASGTIEKLLGRRYDRRWNRQQGELKIHLRREEEMMERLMGDGWIKSTMDRARIVSDDLLSSEAVKELTKKLAEKIYELIKDPLEGNEIKIVDKKPENGEIHTRLIEVRPYILDLGAAMMTKKDFRWFPTYLSASIYLFCAAADAWWSFSTGDSSQEIRKTMYGIIEKFLRNYLALVLIDEAKHEAQKLERAKTEQSKTEQSKPEESKTQQSSTEQASTDAAGAANSKPEETKTGEQPPVTCNIARKPVPPAVPPRQVPSMSNKWYNCCGLL